MVDANIIVSAILFPNSVVARAFNHMINNYTLVLSQYTIHEVEDVFNEMNDFMKKRRMNYLLWKKLTVKNILT